MKAFQYFSLDISTWYEKKDILRGEGFETCAVDCPLKPAKRSTSLCCRVKLLCTATQHVLRQGGSKQILARVGTSTIPC